MVKKILTVSLRVFMQIDSLAAKSGVTLLLLYNAHFNNGLSVFVLVC